MPFIGGHWYVILIVLVIVLIVYGPGKLPDVGGAIGRGIREFKKASSDLTDEIKKPSSSEPTSETKSSPETKPGPDLKSPTDTKA